MLLVKKRKKRLSSPQSIMLNDFNSYGNSSQSKSSIYFKEFMKILTLFGGIKKHPEYFLYLTKEMGKVR